MHEDQATDRRWPSRPSSDGDISTINTGAGTAMPGGRRSLSRRSFLGGALSLSTAAILAGCGSGSRDAARGYTGETIDAAPTPGGRFQRWSDVRALFELDPEVQHLSAFILAPHSKPVRDAIDRHRRGLDRDSHAYFFTAQDQEQRGADAAAQHLSTDADLIALTDSTSMGLGLLIGAMDLKAGDEVLTTAHDHYMAHESIRYAAERTGASVSKIELYPPQAPEEATVSNILSAVKDGITSRTRLILVTWVHTASGIRLPVREIADVVAVANRGRSEQDRVLLMIDGAHALGAGPIAIEDVGCDAFVASGHKWLLGPRGTGIAWANEAAWSRITPTIPSWDNGLFGPWIDGNVGSAPPGRAFTPGGYHSFEHRWALGDAFDLQHSIGPDRIAARIDELSGRMRDGLATSSSVTVHAPAEEQLRSGIVCFSVDGIDPDEVVQRLDDDRVAASVTPYAVSFARMGTCWLNTEHEVDAAVRAVRRLAA